MAAGRLRTVVQRRRHGESPFRQTGFAGGRTAAEAVLPHFRRLRRRQRPGTGRLPGAAGDRDEDHPLPGINTRSHNRRGASGRHRPRLQSDVRLDQGGHGEEDRRPHLHPRFQRLLADAVCSALVLQEMLNACRLKDSKQDVLVALFTGRQTARRCRLSPTSPTGARPKAPAAPSAADCSNCAISSSRFARQPATPAARTSICSATLWMLLQGEIGGGVDDTPQLFAAHLRAYLHVRPGC